MWQRAALERSRERGHKGEVESERGPESDLKCWKIYTESSRGMKD